MFDFNALNKSIQTVREGIDLQALPFKRLKDYHGQTLKVDGFFFTKGKYGKQVVLVANGAKINMPARAVEEFEIIAKTPDALQTMLDGHLILTDINERETTNGATTIYKFGNI